MSLLGALYWPIHIVIVGVRRLHRVTLDALGRFRVRLSFNTKLRANLLPTDTIDDQYRREIQAYWGRYVRIGTGWHKWYTSRSGVRDVRFIPPEVSDNFIIPHYCWLECSEAYTDKTMYSLLFPHVKQPVMIAKNQNGVCYDENFCPITQEDVVSRCLLRDRMIIKPAIVSGGGRDIRVLDKAGSPDYEREIRAALAQMGKNYVIQEMVKQHEDLSRIHPDSVNTVRTMSFYYEGEVHILLSVLRMGVNGSPLDNLYSGGIVANIRPDGRLDPVAFNGKGTRFTVHPQGFTLSEGLVPNYQKIIDTIRAEHPRFGHHRIIFWDFTIDQDGDPVMIEYNIKNPGISSQIASGPLFGDLTDKVLEEVFHSGKKQRRVVRG